MNSTDIDFFYLISNLVTYQKSCCYEMSKYFVIMSLNTPKRLFDIQTQYICFMTQFICTFLDMEFENYIFFSTSEAALKKRLDKMNKKDEDDEDEMEAFDEDNVPIPKAPTFFKNSKKKTERDIEVCKYVKRSFY